MNGIIPTGDGSHTFFASHGGPGYHSRHGAVSESLHVFIQQGLLHLLEQRPAALRIFEMGFGTGLNCLLTLREARKFQIPVWYYAVENNWLPESVVLSLNYPQYLQMSPDDFLHLHRCEMDKESTIDDHFRLNKMKADLLVCSIPHSLDLVYFDAFAPDDQPEVWEERVFRKIFAEMKPGGILVTYSAKGELKRTLRRTGFDLEILQEPPKKREMTRAIKTR